MSYIIKVYETNDGKLPFEIWLNDDLDPVDRARVRRRLRNIMLGNFGEFKFLGDGIGEMILDWGPGYRIYYHMTGEKTVLLLCAGSKKRQQNDIDKAKRLLVDYKARGKNYAKK